MLTDWNTYTTSTILRKPLACGMYGCSCFLSPDPYVQAPTNSQNFNRYSYCLNNPLKYTDPSGESIIAAAIIIGAIAGTYIGGTMANDNYNPTRWNYKNGTTWRYMFWGSVVGSLASGVSASICGGISSAMAGGSFWAGAVGSETAASATGFCAGFVSGGASGASSGALLGAGNAIIGGKPFNEIISSSWNYCWKGAISGAITGGLFEGINAKVHGRTFWTGTLKTKQNVIINCNGTNYPMTVNDDGSYAKLQSDLTKDYYRTDLYNSPDVTISEGPITYDCETVTFNIKTPSKVNGLNVTGHYGNTSIGCIGSTYDNNVLSLTFYKGLEPQKIAISGWRYNTNGKFCFKSLFNQKNWGRWIR